MLSAQDFLLEARRTLKVGGTLIIAEVASRINGGGSQRAASNGGESTCTEGVGGVGGVGDVRLCLPRSGVVGGFLHLEGAHDDVCHVVTATCFYLALGRRKWQRIRAVRARPAPSWIRLALARPFQQRLLYFPVHPQQKGARHVAVHLVVRAVGVQETVARNGPPPVCCQWRATLRERALPVSMKLK